VADVLEQQGVTVFNQTPTAFYNLIPALANRQLALRYVVFGGEALSPAKLQPWFQQHGTGAQLVNMYGITETTVHASFYPLTPQDCTRSQSPIGKLLPDLTGYVFNEPEPGTWQPVPDYTIGELFIAGAGVVRGYWQQPELTAARFVAHPGEPHIRLYRTGDLVKRLPSGELLYEGRADQQVKLRGFRIETGEIESALAALDGIAAAVVVLQTQERQSTEKWDQQEYSQQEHSQLAETEPFLAAYLLSDTTQAASKPALSEIRQQLQQRLPYYMIPATYQFLTQLPVNENGKINRGLLPVPSAADRAIQAFVAPQTEQEQILAAIWQSVLGLEQAGVHDNFFDLGGDSIKSLAIVNQLREAGWQLELAQLLSTPMLQAQALHLSVLVSSSEPQTPKAAANQPLVQPFELCSQVDQAKLPTGVVDAYPISQLQSGMIFHYDSGRPGLYHNVSRIVVNTCIDQPCFTEALQVLVQRHDSLRTSFHLQGYSQPLQLVHRDIELPLTFLDLRVLGEQEQQQTRNEIFDQCRESLMDIDTAPLFRIQVNVLSESQSELIWSEHHALLDGWSVEIILNELSRLYQAAVNKQLGSVAHSLVSAPAYRHFIAAEQQALQSEASLAFWQQYLQHAELTSLSMSASSLMLAANIEPANIEPANTEPADTGAEHGQTPFGVQTTRLSAALTAQVQALAKSLQVPLKSVLLACHMFALKTFSGQQDVVSGLSLHGRPALANSERSTGLYVTVLPVRVTFASDNADTGLHSWQQLIQAVSRTEQQIWSHRYYPLSKIVTASEAISLFRYSFNYLDFTQVQRDDTALLNQLDDLQAQAFNEFDMAVTFEKVSDGLAMGFTFNALEMSRQQIHTLQAYYQTVLQAMVANPLGDLYAISRDDLALLQQLSGANGASASADTNAETSPETNTLLSERFSALAAQQPSDIALIEADQSLSYQALDTQSNQFAHYLQSQGVNPGDRVAIVTSRSAVMVVAMLGILKAGACYVPVDAAYPPERISHMLAQSQAHFVLYQAAVAATILLDAEHFDILEAAFDKAASLPGDFVALPHPQNLLNLIFTSGSTGLPKGVQVKQQGLLRLVDNRAVRQMPGKEMVMLHLSALAFDAATEEIWLPLLSGGRLVIYPEQRVDLSALSAVIKQYQVNCAFLTNALFQQWVAQLPASLPGDATGLTHLTVGGEPIDCASTAALYQKDATVQVFNGYGPTENTVFSTFFAMPREHHGITAAPIGQPLTNSSAQVLEQGADGQLRPVPMGAPGQLFLGGNGVALGYFNDDEQTGRQFYRTSTGTLYASGDIASWREDKLLHIAGRVDDQIKFRGFRIEPLEIEQVLLAHAEVSAAAVLLMEVEGDKKLVAFVTLHATNTPASAAEVNRAMKDQVRAHCPQHLVPSVAIALEAMPVTGNGKLDRRALANYPVAKRMAELPGRKILEPATPTEQVLLPLWCDVLKLQQVSTDSNFFELGGDSISATRLVSAVNHALSIELALNQVFEYQTIQTLAAHIDTLPGNATPAQPSSTQPSSTQPSSTQGDSPTDDVETLTF